MRKRVSLARALVLDPEMVLFDEPSAGLDPVISSVIDELIISLTERSRATSIIVTHEMDSAFRIATRMAMLYEGKVIADAEPERFKKSDNPVVQQFLSGSTEGPIWKEAKMQLRRNEIMTGLLVLSTVGVLTLSSSCWARRGCFDRWSFTSSTSITPPASNWAHLFSSPGGRLVRSDPQFACLARRSRPRPRSGRQSRRPGGLPPPAVQIAAQPLDLAAWTVGEHADRAHTDHDLAGGRMMWQLRSNPRRGCCQQPVTQQPHPR